jgi:hypothetical protein
MRWRVPVDWAAAETMPSMSPDQPTIYGMSFLPAGKKAQIYLIAMVLAAAPIYFICLHHSFFNIELWWLFLGAVAAFVSWFPLRLSSIQDRLWLTLGDLFIFVALFHFGTEVAVVIASFEAIVFNLRKQPKRAFRWVFNIAQITVVVFLVGKLYEYLNVNLAGFESSRVSGLLLLILAPWLCGFVYYALTSGLTGLAVALHGSHSFLEVWTRNLSWYYVPILGAVLAALTHIAVQPWSG